MSDDLPDLDIDADAIAGESAAATLGQMAQGGSILVSLATDRLSAAQRAIEEGRFSDADRLAREAVAKTSPLATFEQTMAAFAGRVRIVRVKDVENGMMLIGMGRVGAIEPYECNHHAGSVQHHFRFVFEDGDQVEYDGEREVFVSVEEDGASD